MCIYIYRSVPRDSVVGSASRRGLAPWTSCAKSPCISPSVVGGVRVCVYLSVCSVSAGERAREEGLVTRVAEAGSQVYLCMSVRIPVPVSGHSCACK